MKDHMEGFQMNKNETDALVIHEILAIQSLAQRMREPPDWSGARLPSFISDAAGKVKTFKEENMEYTITKNAEFGSLEMRFDEKPADTVRLALKRLKMRWHGSINAGTDTRANPPLSAPFLRTRRRNSPRPSFLMDTWAAAQCTAARAVRRCMARISRRRFGQTSRRQGSWA